ncbi:MAG: hydratase [Burkholderiales bacterium]|nr:hydratase [Burkholderiales bacterium]
MQNSPALQAAQRLARSWLAGEHLDDLPPPLRPRSLEEGRAIQALWAGVVGDAIAGWKIAATSEAGQRHIAVAGPIAGPVFARRVVCDGATVSLAGNRMRVAECEVVFTIGRTLDPRPQPYSRSEVLAAVQWLHPGIKVPDSRFREFERAGEAQLAADCACCNDMVLGAAVAPDERIQALPALVVQARVSDGRTPQGAGRNVLGDPVAALCWLANELRASGRALEAGQFVTTGACVAPIAVLPGQRVEADFGWIGRIAASFA